MSQSIVHEVLAKKPKRRVEWVQKRLKEDLAIQHRDSLYEVLVRKEGRAFAADINGADAMRTYNAVLAAIDLFTTKQQRHLQGDNFLLRKLHKQEQEKQERYAKEAKARAQEAKKAAKAAKERPKSAPTRPARTSPDRVQDSPKTRARSPDARPSNTDAPRSRSRSPLPRADATKAAERSPSPDWIPRTPPDPPAQVPTKSTGSWTTTVFDELPVKDDRAPTVVAPRPEPPKQQPADQIFRSLDDVSTLGVKELAKDSEADAGQKRQASRSRNGASSSSTEYDAFGTGPDPVALRSPSRDRKGVKPAPTVSRDTAAEAGGTSKPSPSRGSSSAQRTVPADMPPADASSQVQAAAKGDLEPCRPSEERSRLPGSSTAAEGPAVKEEPEAKSEPSAPHANGTAEAGTEPRSKSAEAAASSEAAAPCKTEGPSGQSDQNPKVEPPASDDEEEEDEEEEEEEEEASEEGSESESSSSKEDAGSQAPTSPAQGRGSDDAADKQKQEAEDKEGSGSESGSSDSASESDESPKPPPRVKLVKLEEAPRTKPVLEPAKREPPKLEPAKLEPAKNEREPLKRRRLPPPPPPPRRSRDSPIAGIKVPEATHSTRAAQLPYWRYMAPDGQERLAIRSGPGLDAATTGLSLASGEVFPVREERPGDGGVLFLRIADGRGWVFDRKCGRARKRRARPLCVPYQVPLLEDDGDRASPKAQGLRPRALGPGGPLPLDQLSSVNKQMAGHKGRKRRRRSRAPATVDPYLGASTGGLVAPGEVIEVGSDDDGAAEEQRGSGNKMGFKRQVVKEQLREQLERKQNEVQALRNKLNQLDSGQASQMPVRRVVMRTSSDSRTVGMAEVPEGTYQQGQLLDEKRQQLQAMLAKKRATGLAQSSPAHKPTPRYVD